jgi:hypothetical protein
MARNTAVAIQNQFTRGLITEATGLNFPENACTDTYNCVFRQIGTVQRRLGFDFETDHVNKSVTRNNSVISEFLWENVASQGSLTFVVSQVGNVIYFYEAGDAGSLSPNAKSFSINLDTYKISGSPATGSVSAQYASGKGYLFIAHLYCDPLYVAYNADTDTITISSIVIQTRDFEGVDDGLVIDFRPSTLSNAHKYNLYNQGWFAAVEVADDFVQNVLSSWDYKRSDFPSNSDIWYLQKTADGRPDFNHLKVDTGNTPASKGHYILNAFNQDRSSVSGIAGFSIVSASYYRPTAIAFFAGRVFYSGVTYKGFGSKIYFSQIIERDSQFSICYQQNDPSSENLSDLLASDGGVINILDIGTIYKLSTIGEYLLVFASNGVWAISGSQGIGFSANDYSIKKLASVNSISGNSFVIASGLPFWWNYDGIYTVQQDPNTGALSVSSVSEPTIKSFYDNIPSSSKVNVKGAYNSLSRIIQWVFNSEDQSDIESNYNYNRILNLNLVSGAFYPWTVSQATGKPTVNGIIASKGSGTVRESSQVIDAAGNIVIDASSNNVIISTSDDVSLVSSFRYIITTQTSGSTYNLTFAQESANEYLDWQTEDYDSYGVTGYSVHGSAIRNFQSNYVRVFSNVDPNSSIYLQGLWDYSSGGNSGRWTVRQQAYKNVDNYDITSTRLKIRGNGLALQIKFFSESGKPFNIIGWSTFETGNATP